MASVHEYIPPVRQQCYVVGIIIAIDGDDNRGGMVVAPYPGLQSRGEGLVYTVCTCV